MTTEILCIGIALLATTWAVASSVRCARLVRESKECADTLTAVELSRTAKAEVEERDDGLLPYFAVYRQALGRKVDVARYTFDPSDPDDVEYKRIHAYEVAEKLSETP